jgi:hypothetical protein
VPFLRVIRDKRGYETTYLLHWYREGGRQRSRILYVFRTPGGVRVGRHPLEPDVLRQIERQHPDIAFDWAVVRENQQIVEPPMDARRRRPTRDEGEPAAEPPALPQAAASSTPEHGPASRPSVPSRVEGATPDEQLAFLARWYPIIRDQIPQRISDPARTDALLALTERLNPGTWTDADQITTGLQQASEALERLSHVFAKRRRRSRRRPGDSRSAAKPDPQPPAE